MATGSIFVFVRAKTDGALPCPSLSLPPRRVRFGRECPASVPPLPRLCPSGAGRCPAGVPPGPCPAVFRRSPNCQCPAGVLPVSRRCPATVPPLSRYCAATVPPLSHHCPATVPPVSRVPQIECAVAVPFCRTAFRLVTFQSVRRPSRL